MDTEKAMETVISLAEKNKVISYETLKKELALESTRDLEALIIEMIGLNLIEGIIDQEKCCIEVYQTVARDCRPEDFPQYVGTLRDWLQKCDHILQTVEVEISQANKMAEESVNAQLKLQERIDIAKSKEPCMSSVGHYGFDVRKRDEKTKRSMGSKYLRGFKTPKSNKKEN